MQTHTPLDSLALPHPRWYIQDTHGATSIYPCSISPTQDQCGRLHHSGMVAMSSAKKPPNTTTSHQGDHQTEWHLCNKGPIPLHWWVVWDVVVYTEVSGPKAIWSSLHQRLDDTHGHGEKRPRGLLTFWMRQGEIQH